MANEKNVTPVLPNVTAGITKIGNEWFINTIRYNPETKQASVVESKSAGVNEHVAFNEFKVTLYRLEALK